MDRRMIYAITFVLGVYVGMAIMAVFIAGGQDDEKHGRK